MRNEHTDGAKLNRFVTTVTFWQLSVLSKVFLYVWSVREKSDTLQSVDIAFIVLHNVSSCTAWYTRIHSSGFGTYGRYGGLAQKPADGLQPALILGGFGVRSRLQQPTDPADLIDLLQNLKLFILLFKKKRKVHKYCDVTK
jgi:hypothetical protein